MTELQQRLTVLCRRFGVTSLYAFGSRSASLATSFVGGAPAAPVSPVADADIGVEPAPGALRSAGERVALACELEELLRVSRVDLVVLPEAGAFLAADIVRGELLFCEDEDRQSLEELCYLRRAGDLAPFQHERLRALLAGELRQ